MNLLPQILFLVLLETEEPRGAATDQIDSYLVLHHWMSQFQFPGLPLLFVVLPLKLIAGPKGSNQVGFQQQQEEMGLENWSDF